MSKLTHKTLVSIVFTSYNHAEYLKQAIDSLIHQTFRNFELIVIDDCSTDGSQEILKDYENVPEVRLYLLQKNSGSYVKASNYGARLAIGEFLLFAQCDDFAAPNQLEELLKPFSSKNIGVVYSRSNLVNNKGEKYDDDFRGRERLFKHNCSTDSLISGSQMKRFLSYSCVIPNLSAAMMRRKLFNDVGGLSEEYYLAADWAFWLTLSENTDFYYLKEPLNNFRQHSTTIRNQIKVKKQIIEIYSIFYGHIDKYKLDSSQSTHLKKGAGKVWFSYFFLDRYNWILMFLDVYKDTSKFEKQNLLYLFYGILFFMKNHSPLRKIWKKN